MMQCSPENPNHWNRDRFVLSKGHACLFQYVLMHLVTTGPLGQAIANAVGLAMANKCLTATYNKPDFSIVSNQTWLSISLAGHRKFNNLILIHDNNQVTCDGSLDLVCTEDVNVKMVACGWRILTVEDGNKDLIFITAGEAVAHGRALGPEDVANIKRDSGWQKISVTYREKYPTLAAEFGFRVKDEMVDDWAKFIPAKEALPTTPTPSRVSAGLVGNPLAAGLRNIMVGTADLSPSPDLRPICGINGDYAGRYIHWGVREFVMAAISNGLAAFNKGTILPVTSLFFMFYLYTAIGAIHIATHDSTGPSEDGPTHPPIELAALYRAMPNLLYIRPCDSKETAGVFIAALRATSALTIISLSRQALPQYLDYTLREGLSRGAYVFSEDAEGKVTLISVGSERLFEAQDRAYKDEVIEYRSRVPRVVVEAYAATRWEKYANAGYSMSSFGHSLPSHKIYEHLGYDPDLIALRVCGFLCEL
ncbi:transketolase [Xylariaceae sp. FL0255]|nr:transketolase [Xylariaceae sp. FL0255]